MSRDHFPWTRAEDAALFLMAEWPRDDAARALGRSRASISARRAYLKGTEFTIREEDVPDDVRARVAAGPLPSFTGDGGSAGSPERSAATAVAEQVQASGDSEPAPTREDLVTGGVWIVYYHDGSMHPIVFPGGDFGELAARRVAAEKYATVGFQRWGEEKPE